MICSNSEYVFLDISEDFENFLRERKSVGKTIIYKIGFIIIFIEHIYTFS